MDTKTKETAMIESIARMVSREFYPLNDLDPVLLNDKEFMISLLNINGRIYEGFSFSDTLRNDVDVIMAAVSQDPYTFYALTSELRLNKQIALAVLKKEGRYLEEMDYSLRQDRDVVLTAIKSYPYAIASASDKFKNDRDLALLAVTGDPGTITYLSTKFKDDKDIVLIVVSAEGNLLREASARLRDDREVIWSAIHSITGCAFHYISDRLKKDRDLVLEGVKRFGDILSEVGDDLKNDREVVHGALVTAKTGILKYASTELRNDLDTVVTALYYSDKNAEHISNELKSHPAVQFMLDNPNIRISSDWPIIKRALVEQHARFLNPPAIITELAGELENKYFIYAQHALSESCAIDNVELPVFE